MSAPGKAGAISRCKSAQVRSSARLVASVAWASVVGQLLPEGLASLGVADNDHSKTGQPALSAAISKVPWTRACLRGDYDSIAACTGTRHVRLTEGKGNYLVRRCSPRSTRALCRRDPL